MRGSIQGCRSVPDDNVLATLPLPQADGEAPHLARPLLTPVVTYLRREPFAAVGASIYAGIIVAAVFAPQLAPYDPHAMLREGRRIARYLPISSSHWLGTTAGGQDVLSQLIYGARAA